jgi:ABC-2 type transport system permease protein
MIGGPSLLGVFIRRDWAIALSYRFNFVLEIFQILVSLFLFFYLSRIVDDAELTSSSQLEEGYFAFVVVGLAFMRFMETGLTAFALQLRTDQTTGTLEALLVTPARQSLVVLGSASYELLLAAASGFLMLAIAVIGFGLDLSVSVSSVLVLIAAVPAAFGLFAAVGVVVAAFTIVFKQVATLVAFATTGIAVLAGVYFPLSLLPDWLENLAEALPFSWALDILREALLGGDPSIGKLAALIGFCLVAVPASMALFAAAVNRAKRTGTLAQY